MERSAMDLPPIKQAVIEGDDKQLVNLTRRALDEGHSAESVLNEALIVGMGEVGELFEQGEYFVPELLLSARAMQAAMGVLRPLLSASSYEPLGKVVMATVQGDLHDIGKKLVAMMLEGAGFQVVDLGTDVSPARFVAAVEESGAGIVGVSALLPTPLPAPTAGLAAGEYTLVAGVLGPTGKLLLVDPAGRQALVEAFAEQARALEEGGVDFFHVETMFDLEEAVAAVEGIRSVSSLPVALTMSF